MANTAHLFRRQSSRDLGGGGGGGGGGITSFHRSIDHVELKELRGRLLKTNKSDGSRFSLYGATNPAFVSDIGGVTEHPQQNDTILSSAAATARIPLSNDDIIQEKPEDDRESWDSKLTFLLATIGYAVGLGNVWRFPYLAQKNGGGAFLVPYFVMLCIQGIPIFYLELAIGQRLRKGAIGVWHQVSPYLGGIGISSAVVSFIVALYYNTIIAWCLIYFFHSFENPLPWAECPKRLYKNFTYDIEPECVASSPTQYYWYRSTLLSSSNVNEAVEFNYSVAISLIVAWFLVYICMIQGITSSGKIVYITAIFPYLVLIIFFFRGITLKGSTDGIAHLFTPRWESILEPVVWLEAGTQIFFSLGLAFGGLIAFSSYNPANNNCFRDAIIVSLTNCSTSMFAGVVVFSVIGFKATATFDSCTKILNEMISLNETENLPTCDLQKELANVNLLIGLSEKFRGHWLSASGTGLAFIIFTEAINQFPGAQFWAVLFFLMLFTLGIDSQFGTLEGVATSLVDMKLFPKLSKDIIIGGLCLSCCILSMSFAHGAGSYVFQLMDSFAGNFSLLIIALCECLAVSYVYGIKRFADDIELMTGSRPGLYWMFCWKYLSPIAMITILTASFIELASEGSSYPGWNPTKGVTEKLEWPHWCIIFAIFLILISVLWIPIIAITRFMGMQIVEDTEPAWFPESDLREVHGIVPYEPTELEALLFCIKPDGTEGLCCPSYDLREQTLQEEDEE